jgi:archaellin
MKRKANIGIGTLVTFIALLLVAAIEASVLIQNSGKFKESAYKTSSQAKDTITTAGRFVEVSATDGSDSKLNYFTAILRLASGSDDIKLENVIFSLSVDDLTASLTYAGTDATFENSIDGYHTLNQVNMSYSGSIVNLTADFDDDGLPEDLSGGSGGSDLFFNLSSGVSINLGNCNAGTHDNPPSSNDYINSAQIICSGNEPERVIINPKNIGKGKFSVSYLQISNNHIPGNIRRGEVIKIFFEAPRAIENDEKIKIMFLSGNGHPTLIEFKTPQVISDNTIFLYP